ncbi:MAG TPA: hypothetical protein VIC05_06040 [Solirubrobacteraceae bacterium]|jgi:hypothetical protein
MTGRARARAHKIYLPVFSLLALGALAGCGSGGSGSSTYTAATAFPTPGHGVANSGPAVAYVSGTPIAKSSYEHWLTVERAMGGSVNPSHSALGFLITSSWVLGEAAGRHITVSEAEVKRRVSQLEQKAFPKKGDLQKFFATSHQTAGDLLARVRVEMLEGRIAEVIKRKTTLSAFEKNFQTHWKALTNCVAEYVMEDCKQYKGAPEQLQRATSSSSSSSSRQGQSSASSSSGEVYSSPGAFSISSPEFERNGPIPTQYTCTGKGISPKLEWTKVPKGAAELFLFVIDDNAASKEGGIRWVVGGIDPTSTGVTAGKVPPGGIVGTNTAGKAAYSPICPAKGKSDTIEFVMYALKKKISISPGFQPTKAESEYGSHKLLMGQAAVNYGIATR